MMADQNLLFVN